MTFSCTKNFAPSLMVLINKIQGKRDWHQNLKNICNSSRAWNKEKSPTEEFSLEKIATVRLLILT